jgi:hypothetical protein
MQYSSQGAVNPLILEVYRGADGVMTLYEDDGETMAYANGEYSETRFEVSENGSELVCRVCPPTGTFAGQVSDRSIVLNIHLQPEVSAVTCEGQRLGEAQTPDALDTRSAGWSYDKRKRVLLIKLGAAARVRTIRVV